jgi:hydroxybutyrate-dimer hydrolase
MSVRPHLCHVFAAATALFCSGAATANDFRDRPAFIRGDISTTRYDGVSDDLLTAGLGAAGLQSPTAPTVGATPTAQELRRLAIYTNYRALVDMTNNGGYGRFYGPNVSANGTPTGGPGFVAGIEALAYGIEDGGASKVTYMVQVPDSYDPARGCIVAAPSSGSRGVYGAIATAGEWGLKRGCAVAYTDKGTGTGAHDLQNNQVQLLRGEPANADAAGERSQFTARIAQAQREAYNAAFPHRFAFKHAHSQANPERNWGRDVVRSIEFAFYVLNTTHGDDGSGRGRGRGGRRIDKNNTIVIASSVSNGGGASLRAAELDRGRLIDGVAVAEPNVNPVYRDDFTINQQGRQPLREHSRPLMDYSTFLNLYEGCAAMGYTPAQAPLNLAPSPDRCAALRAAGLLRTNTLAEQAAEAQARINEYGFLPEQNLIQPALWFSYVPQSISVTYANSYGRFSVLDNLCGFSFAAVDAARRPAPLAPAAAATLFGTSNGIPPTSGISLINNGANLEDRASSPDQNLAGALCLRSLVTGQDAATGTALIGDSAQRAQRVQQGVSEVLASGDLHGVPAIIVTGRNDNILPPNFTSRPYFGLNKGTEGQRSGLRYYEVTNAQHLDSLNALAGFDNTMVPLHRYFIQAMDLMYAHLRDRAPLPESQVVRTTPRGGAPGAAPPLTAANVPPIAANPGANAITFTGRSVNIPE